MSYETPSVADVFKTIFMVMNAKPENRASMLVLTASPQLQDEVAGHQLQREGVHRSVWTLRQAKSIARAFRDLGYTVLVYKYNFVAEWFKTIAGLVELTDYEDFDQPSAPSINYDLSEIAAVLPECHTYVELFGGGAPLFMSRAPSSVEVYNDCDRHVINLFDQLREPQTFNWFFLLTRIFSVNSYLHPTALREVIRKKNPEDGVIMAYLWYQYLRQVWALSPLTSSMKVLGADSTFEAVAAVDSALPEIHGRLMRMQHEHNTTSKILDIYDSEDTLFWVDPSEHGRNAVHVGSKSEENNFDSFLSRLSAVKGAVALYLNHKDQHHGFAQRSEFFADPSNGWVARDFKSSTVWLKNATFKEN